MTSKNTEKNKADITSRQMKILLKERELMNKVKNSLIDSTKDKKEIDENIEFLLRRL